VGSKLLREIARQVLGPEKARQVWSRIEIIGDIAVIKKPLTHDYVTLEDLRRLAQAIMDRLPYVRSVWAVTSPTGGSYKTRGLVHLAGERRTETLYKEHGCRFLVDIAKVFITPRLSYEHLRIARLVRPGEVVVNMFAGAGLFSIIAACHSSPRKVYSIDINPEAFKYMKKNVELNKVESIVEPILGDAARVVEERLKGTSDRVLMPLPELALEYLPYGVMALRGRGTIHVYLHVDVPRKGDPLAESERLVARRLEEIGVPRYRLLGSRRVRGVGPRRLQTVVDVEVEP